MHFFSCWTGGTEGLFAQKTLEITEDIIACYRNQGFHPNYSLFFQDENFASCIRKLKASALNICTHYFQFNIFFVVKVVMGCWEEQRIRSEQQSKWMLHWLHARSWTWMGFWLLEVNLTNNNVHVLHIYHLVLFIILFSFMKVSHPILMLLSLLRHLLKRNAQQRYLIILEFQHQNGHQIDIWTCFVGYWRASNILWGSKESICWS